METLRACKCESIILKKKVLIHGLLKTIVTFGVWQLSYLALLVYKMWDLI